MPDFQEKAPGPQDVLPRPDLNPLVNPVLENHLGEWAEVYFTSPPEKREQAVEELLRELQRVQASEPVETAAPGAELALPAEILCPMCQVASPAGQRFCGNCGAQLQNQAAALLPEEAAASLSSPLNQSVAKPVTDPTEELRWLRQKSFSQWDGVQSPAVAGRKLFVAGAALILVFAAGSWAALHWLGGEQSPRSSPPVVSEVPATTLAATAATVQAAPAEPASLPAPQRSPERRLSSGQRQSSNSTLPAESGAQGLLLARQELDARNGVRDSRQAATFLWKAVGKQNVQAALLLSDLYARGDGVAKSCDQARLLLVAAARKGSPAAAQQLRSLESSGCH